MLHPEDRKNAYARGYLEARISSALIELEHGHLSKAMLLLATAKRDAEDNATRNLNEVSI